MFAAAPNVSDNPRLIFSTIRDTVDVVAPDYIVPIIEEGIRDGSIQTEYPEEFAELVILIANMWLNPMIFDSTPEETYRKIMVFRQMMQGFGLDIVDDEMRDRMRDLAALYQKNR